jgi:GNAT superfamily N-acetyltransferase
MRINSLFLKSEMIFWQFGSEIIDQEDHIAIRTPRNPTWRWGNLLLFPHPPIASDLTKWNATFETHFGRGSEHRLFVWDTRDGETGDTLQFTDDGYVLSQQPLLSATALTQPPPSSATSEYRILSNDDEWEAAIRMNINSFAKDDLAYEAYMRAKFDLYREMVSARLGLWIGAFSGAELVASCGIFQGNGLTRYQEVVTAPSHRGLGVASQLVFRAFVLTRELGYPELTLIAVDAGSQAERIYRRLGFGDCETTCALTKLKTLDK